MPLTDTMLRNLKSDGTPAKLADSEGLSPLPLRFRRKIMTDGLPLRRKKKNAQLWRRSVFCVYLTNLTLAPAFKTHMSFLISSLKTWHRLLPG